MAQRLQARGQAQHDHAQIARKGQQHFAHALGLGGSRLRHGRGLAGAAGGVLGDARHALQAHEFAGFLGQIGKVGAKSFADDFVRFVQVLAGVDQIAGRLHGLGATDSTQDGGHRVGMGQHVLGGVEQGIGQQGLGKSPRTRERIGCGGCVGRGGHRWRGAAVFLRPSPAKSPPRRRSGPAQSAWVRGPRPRTQAGARAGRARPSAAPWLGTASPIGRHATARSGR